MYATVVQADEYVQNYYSSSDSVRLAWEALNESDKLVMLNRAEQVIDQLPLLGIPIVAGKAFPRLPGNGTIPTEVEQATIELAVQSLNSEAKDRFELQQQGVRSYKIGDLSETFADSYGGYSGIDSYSFSIVFPFLRGWLGGGYRICPTHIRR